MTGCLEEHMKMAARIRELEAELAATRLKWRTGKPPCDGWYWFSIGIEPWFGFYSENFDEFQVNGHQRTWERKACKWSGPLVPPTDEEGM
jgi:hypothetical protein